MRKSVVMLLSLLMLLAAGCAGSSPAAGPAPPQSPASGSPAAQPQPATPKLEKSRLNLGLSTVGMGFSPVYMALEKGFFTAEGLTVTVSTFKGGTELLQSHIAGAIDIGIGGATEPLDGFLAGQKTMGFFAVANYPAYEWWAAPQFKSMNELAAAKGKVAVSRLGAASHQISRWAFQRAGFDPDKQFQYVQFSGGGAGRVAAMKVGQVDAVPATPPAEHELAQAGFNRLMKLSDVMPEYAWEVAYTKEQFLKENPETVKAFARALIRGMQFMKQDPAAAADIIIKQMGATPESRDATLTSLKAQLSSYPEDGRHPEESYKMFIQFYVESGDIKGSPPTPGAFLDYSVIDYFKQNPVKG